MEEQSDEIPMGKREWMNTLLRAIIRAFYDAEGKIPRESDTLKCFARPSAKTGKALPTIECGMSSSPLACDLKRATAKKTLLAETKICPYY